MSASRSTSAPPLMTVRLIVGALGAAVLARGGYLFVTTISRDQWPNIALWLAGGLLVHDVVIAPVTVLLGRLLHPVAAVRTAWLAAGTVLLVSYPLYKGAQIRRNPTVIPGDPGVDLLICLGVVALGMLIALAIGRFGGRVMRQRASAPQT